ncbi:MAG: DUF933 domain-containing protein [bacterium]
MKVAILGQPQAGQVELFCLLTGPDRIVPAKIEFLLLPDFVPSGPAHSTVINEMKNADAFCWVAKAEQADADVKTFIAELIITDLLLVEKRIENIAKAIKTKADDSREKEMRLMEACKAHLEKEQPLASFPFAEEQRKDIRAYQFVTETPLVIVLNIDDKLPADETIAARVRERFHRPCIQICIGLEEEILRLEEGDRAPFMKEMGISEAAIDRMTRLVFESLNLISFFTVGDKEVRAWPIRKGSSALEAAGTIHSDLARGFIRAEMMKYADLMAAGSTSILKEQGRVYLKGKEYVVEDGDILTIHFNV